MKPQTFLADIEHRDTSIVVNNAAFTSRRGLAIYLNNTRREGYHYKRRDHRIVLTGEDYRITIQPGEQA